MGAEGGETVGEVYDKVGGVDEGKIGCGCDGVSVGVGSDALRMFNKLSRLSRPKITLHVKGLS